MSCTDATDCTAVGYDYNGQPFYATETGGHLGHGHRDHRLRWGLWLLQRRELHRRL